MEEQYGKLTEREIKSAEFGLFRAIVMQASEREDGTIAGALAVGRDCTDRRRSEAALRSRIAQLQDSAQSAFKSNDQFTHRG